MDVFLGFKHPRVFLCNVETIPFQEEEPQSETLRWERAGWAQRRPVRTKRNSKERNSRCGQKSNRRWIVKEPCCSFYDFRKYKEKHESSPTNQAYASMLWLKIQLQTLLGKNNLFLWSFFFSFPQFSSSNIDRRHRQFEQQSSFDLLQNEKVVQRQKCHKDDEVWSLGSFTCMGLFWDSVLHLNSYFDFLFLKEGLFKLYKFQDQENLALPQLKKNILP